MSEREKLLTDASIHFVARLRTFCETRDSRIKCSIHNLVSFVLIWRLRSAAAHLRRINNNKIDEREYGSMEQFDVFHFNCRHCLAIQLTENRFIFVKQLFVCLFAHEHDSFALQVKTKTNSIRTNQCKAHKLNWPNGIVLEWTVNTEPVQNLKSIWNAISCCCRADERIDWFTWLRMHVHCSLHYRCNAAMQTFTSRDKLIIRNG